MSKIFSNRFAKIFSNYQSVNIFSNIFAFQVNLKDVSGHYKTQYTRDKAVVVITLKQSSLKINIAIPSLKVNIPNELCGLSLPAPVPATLLENVSALPAPVPATLLPDPVGFANQPSFLFNFPALEDPVPVPTEEEMKSWPVKKLKSCLGDAGLHQYGLKNDLVQRLLDYYSKNPGKVPRPPQSSQEVAKELLELLLHHVVSFSEAKSRRQSASVSRQITVEERTGSRQIIVDDMTGKYVSLTNAGGVYTLNGRQIPVLGASSGASTVKEWALKDSAPTVKEPQPAAAKDGQQYVTLNGHRIPILGSSSLSHSVRKETQPSQVVVDKYSAEQEKIMKKIGEIKSFEKLKLEFFKTGNSIVNVQDIKVAAGDKQIVRFRLSELDLFSSELAGRRVLVKERDNDKEILAIQKQIANIVIVERKAEVDVLVENSSSREVFLFSDWLTPVNTVF